LKIQDGCDTVAPIATIPLARGKSRSDTIAHVVEQVNVLATLGIKEIVLTGVNTGDFGIHDPVDGTPPRNFFSTHSAIRSALKESIGSGSLRSNPIY